MQNQEAPLAHPSGVAAPRHSLVERAYFTAVSSFLLILSLVAFSDNLITDIGQVSNRDPKFVVHGVFWLAWFILFVVQSRLIRKGNRALHRRLGLLTFLVGLGVILSTAYIFVVTYPGWQEMPVFAKANRFLLLGFAALLGFAFWHRTRPQLHRRFVLMANFYVLLPVIDRVAGRLELNAALFLPGVWNALFASAFLYDYITLGRAHRVTAIGFGVFYLIWVAATLL